MAHILLKGINPSSGGTGGSQYLTGLTDVVVVNPADGEALVYDSGTSTWVNAIAGTGGTSNTNYVREDPSYVSVGGVVAGVTVFDGTLQDALDKLFFPYQQPSFTTFYINGQSSSLEVGQTAATGSITFNWSTSNSDNVSANTVDIRDTTNGVDIVIDTGNTGSFVYDNGTGITKTTNTSHTWTIDAEDINLTNISRNYNVSWYWRFYWGSSTATTADETMIESLQNNNLYNSRNRNYTCDANNYKWLCWPTSFGLANNFKDDSTGFGIPMESPETISVTNSYGVTTNYYAYRTTNSVVDSVVIVVS